MKVDSIMKMLVLVLKLSSQFFRDSAPPQVGVNAYFFEKCHSYKFSAQLLTRPKVNIFLK
jgi:hypothetical protein